MKLIAGQRFYLENENQLVRAISGKLEVYAVTRNESSFRQIFLLELAKGDVAFPAIDEFGYIDFLVYAVDDSEIDLVGIEDLPPQELKLLGCVHTKESIIMAKRIKPAKTISSLS